MPSTTTKRLPIPAEPQPEDVCAVVDTREERPLDLSPLQVTVETLTTGDYSVRGLESVIAIERKSLPDLISCCGGGRERFEREIHRLAAYPVRAVVVEATWPDLEQGEWRSNLTPASAIGSVLGWIAAGVPFVMAGDHSRAGRYVARMLYIAARRRWRENRELVRSVMAEE